MMKRAAMSILILTATSLGSLVGCGAGHPTNSSALVAAQPVAAKAKELRFIYGMDAVWLINGLKQGLGHAGDQNLPAETYEFDTMDCINGSFGGRAHELLAPAGEELVKVCELKLPGMLATDPRQPQLSGDAVVGIMDLLSKKANVAFYRERHYKSMSISELKCTLFGNNIADSFCQFFD